MQKNKIRSMAPIVRVGIVFLFLSAAVTFADEGMWTFDNPPTKQLKERYGFVPTPEWLDHVRLSSVRFIDGGSGSFVSADGLVLTNHHVARGQLQKMSSPQKDYVAEGFLARTPGEEIKSADLELNVLVSQEDITNKVLAVVKPGMKDKEALQARKAEIARIEKESLQATGLRSDVVALYQGGEYWLYRYKKYTDIRLVMAPEQQIAFYGGDPDNFTFPRHDLDFTLFRVYENDKPVRPAHFLKWNSKGAQTGDLVFISGHPGSTNRLYTMAQLEMLRDHSYPARLQTIQRRLGILKKYAARGPEPARQAAGMIFGLENSQKAMNGEYQGLLDKGLMAKKSSEEKEFQSKVDSHPEWKANYGSAWETIAKAVAKQLERYNIYRYQSMGGMRLPGLAVQIVQYTAEIKKADGERLSGFHDAQLESLRFRLFSPAPVYPELEEALLADSLRESMEALGPENPFIKTILSGRPPEAVAKELITGTKLADPAFRKNLVQGGTEAVAKSTDPLIVAALKIEPILREQIKWGEDNVESILVTAGEKIGKARFAVYGKSVNPDATFSLRLSYGAVKGYPMNGTLAPAKTTLYGLYDRAASFDNQPPFHLPVRFLQRRDKLDLTTPVNFVSSGDIIGGNSGSPVINRGGELVGLIFDGNIESLVGRFVYDDTTNRAVSVHSAFIIEALNKLYDAGFLADELLGPR